MSELTISNNIRALKYSFWATVKSDVVTVVCKRRCFIAVQEFLPWTIMIVTNSVPGALKNGLGTSLFYLTNKVKVKTRTFQNI